MGLIESLLIGVVSGVVASVTYAILMKFMRPKIKIVDVAIHNVEKNLFIIKVINRTKSRITDVSCYLQYYSHMSNGFRSIEVKPYISIPPTIEKYIDDRDSIDAPSMYAVQYGFVVPEEVNFSDEDMLVFSIKAVHPVSGTSSYDIMEYEFGKSGKVRKNVAFDAGDNMGVHAIDAYN